MTSLRVEPSGGLRSGSPLIVKWDDGNEGDSATHGSWTDSVVITNITTGEILLTTTVPYDSRLPGTGPILPGETRARQYAYTLPDAREEWGSFRSSSRPTPAIHFSSTPRLGLGRPIIRLPQRRPPRSPLIPICWWPTCKSILPRICSRAET